MDDMNPFYHSSGFMNLLQSQQEDMSQFASGSTEVPAFSSQLSEEGSEEEGNEASDVKPKQSISRKKWTAKEDIVLVSAWLNTSKDPVIGNDQQGQSFWKRIAAYVAASPSLDGMPKREHAQCKQRWAKVNKIVTKFVGCHKTATTHKTSGQSEDDVMKLAHEIYYNDTKKNFTLDHAWRELKFDQKWCDQTTRGGKDNAKRRKCGDGNASSQPINVEDDSVMTRPPGVKAAKAKGRKSATVNEGKKPATGKGEAGQSVEHFQNLWELKEKDWDRKEKQSKYQMLESLLSRTEPLSDIDLFLKNKLITELWS
ncbi:glutathione S-transferase T3-like [Arabidopsis lyrata subsp. lyrata]|uniref:glutathione S-transferase T3-like n=1 Tax=Arabidopsis lyrata subsp. lyrata TaxID=81972 RepID=UPI000A29D8B8|nr:glutathione S-transferase T3-like [Arabidopsis lyrata subsp. lyrata]|eukprot:XP_020880935.1 glutathione S-transferase T3-like [Arabidopsis lyrata subsp. lyrata]